MALTTVRFVLIAVPSTGCLVLDGSDFGVFLPATLRYRAWTYRVLRRRVVTERIPAA